MELLHKGKRYADALFFGHLVLEKILKALVVKHAKNQAPYTHNLVYLSERIGMPLGESDLKVLDSVNDFNILGRYPDWKLEFHKKCTKEFSDNNLKQIKEIYKILCRLLDEKKG